MEAQKLQKKYTDIPEAVSAVEWLKKSRPYLFDQDNPHFITFDTYLDILGISFEERCHSSSSGREIDSYGLPIEDFKVLHVNKSRWDKRDEKENTALMVHEIAGSYIQHAECTFHSSHSRVFAEFFEGDFREEMGMEPCTEALPSSVTKAMRKLEKELKEKIGEIGHFGFPDLLSKYDVMELLYNEK